MNNDFHDHLDAARLWWGLDEAVLEAIAEGPSTRGPYGSIALYVAELKRASVADPGVKDTAALMKIALRLANTPEIAPERPLPRARRPVLRVVSMAALVALALAALLTAAAASEVFPVPQPVRDVLHRIGVDTEAAQKSTNRRPTSTDQAGHHHHHNHLHPVAVQDLAGPDTTGSSNELQGSAVAPAPQDTAAPPAEESPAEKEKKEASPSKPEESPAPDETEPPEEKEPKEERERKRDEDRSWSRRADDDEQ